MPASTKQAGRTRVSSRTPLCSHRWESTQAELVRNGHATSTANGECFTYQRMTKQLAGWGFRRCTGVPKGEKTIQKL